MSERIRLAAACLTLALLAAGALSVGCTVAESKPLDVTYYYLPG